MSRKWNNECKTKTEPNNETKSSANSMTFLMRTSFGEAFFTASAIASRNVGVKSTPARFSMTCAKTTAMIDPSMAMPKPCKMAADKDAPNVSTAKMKLGMLSTHIVDSAKPRNSAVALYFSQMSVVCFFKMTFTS